MHNWRSQIIFLAAILLLPFAVVIIVAIWPFLPILGWALLGLAITWCTCLAIYGVALAYHKLVLMGIRRQREYFSRRYIVAGNVVVFHQEDNPRNLSAEHLQLPAPITLEEPDQDNYSPDDLGILAMVSKGKSQTEAAKAYNTNQPYVSRLVRRWKDQHNMV